MASIVLSILAGLAVSGFMIFRRGLAGRRVGNEPYCPTCGYNLTGLTSRRCPECGNEFTDESIIIGLRQRRKGLSLLGALMLATPAVLVWSDARRTIEEFDWDEWWYHAKPTAWVLYDAQSSDSKLFLRAYHELHSRIEKKQIQGKALQRVVEVALKEFSQPLDRQRGDTTVFWLLERLREERLLSGSQERRLIDAVVRTEMRTLPSSTMDCGVPVCLSATAWRGHDTMCDHGFWRYAIEWLPVVPADQPVPTESVGSTDLHASGEHGEHCQAVTVARTGECELHTLARIKIAMGCSEWGGGGTIIYQTTREVRAKTNVVAGRAADRVKLISDPDREKALIKALFFWTPVHCYLWEGRPRLYTHFSITDCPEGLVLDVQFVAKDRSWPAGVLRAARGTNVYWVATADCDKPDIERVDLVLTPNPGRIGETIDAEIWGKPIRFNDVPVKSSCVTFSSSSKPSGDSGR